jgi:hypothetical protein
MLREKMKIYFTLNIFQKKLPTQAFIETTLKGSVDQKLLENVGDIQQPTN